VAPTITSHPQSASGIEGFSATLSVAASGSAPLSYKWRFNGRDIPDATNTALVLADLRTDQAGQYEAVAMNPRGYDVSQPAILVVNRRARITQHPISQVTTNGTNITFSVAAVGTGTLRYQWQFNNQDIPGATSSSYTIVSAQLHHSGQYRAVVTDDIASVESTAATLEVRMRPIVVEASPTQTLSVGDTLTLSVRVAGSTPIGYRWRRGGLTVTNMVLNSTNSTLVILNAQTNHSGVYNVIITNAAFVTPGVQTNIVVNIVEGTRLELARSGGSILTFNALADKSYTIEYQDTLLPTGWQVLQAVPAGPARQVQVNDPAGGSTRFYRLRTP